MTLYDMPCTPPQGFMKPGNAQQDLLYHLKRGMDEVNMRWGDPLRSYLIFLPVGGWVETG